MSKSKKLISILLILALAIIMLPAGALPQAQAADAGKAIQLGTSGISGYNSTTGYDYIYFGSWNGSNIKWRVLDDQTNTEGTGLFLLSDVLFGSGTYGDVFFQQNYHKQEITGAGNDLYHKGAEPGDGNHEACVAAHLWQGSDAQQWCSTFAAGAFQSYESSAILPTTKNGTDSKVSSPDILNNEKIFFLSAEEALNATYGFTDSAARIANYNNAPANYWLRSAYQDYTALVMGVTTSGSVYTFDTWGDNVSGDTFNSLAARPAFNLDRNSVLFTSAAPDDDGNGDGKTDNAGTLGTAGTPATLDAIGNAAANGWKLTLKDDGHNGFTVTSPTSPLSATLGDEVSVTYSGAKTGSNEYVSVILTQTTDGVETPLYYGHIAQNSASGTVTITIPSDSTAPNYIPPGQYKMNVFSEQCNGGKLTDLAGEFISINLEINFPSTLDTAPTAINRTYDGTTKPLVTAGAATGGTVMYSLDGTDYSTTIPTAKDAGTYTVYYKVTGDENHSDLEPQTVSVTVSKATLTATYAGEKAATGTTPALTVTVTGFVGGETATTAADYVAPIVTSTATAAGTYTLTPGGGSAKNYGFTYVSGKLVITDNFRGTVTIVGGGTGASGNGTYPRGDTVTISAGTKSGYTFSGWTVPPGVTLADANAATTTFTMPGSNVTVTANWTATGGGSGGGGSGGDATYYTLHYESNGGAVYPRESYPYGTTVQLTKVPTREGYQFTGWYADAGLTEKITSVKMNSSKTVYAGWVASTVPELLNGDDHIAYIIGYSDGTVHPGANISRAEVATIFFRLLKDVVRDENLTTANTFSDVTEGMWCNMAISTIAELGIVKGRSAETFDPNANITRAEFAAICARFDAGLTEGDSDFTDISGHWAELEIKRAVSLGWILGYGDGTFRPDAPITRAEAMTMTNRVLCRIPENKSDLLSGMRIWPDNQPDAWYYLAVQEATNSHNFVHKGEIYETWTELTIDPDWNRYQN